MIHAAHALLEEGEDLVAPLRGEAGEDDPDPLRQGGVAPRPTDIDPGDFGLGFDQARCLPGKEEFEPEPVADAQRLRGADELV